ncbi:hypothetical protein AN958_01658 [Leucoagaricus sp. SymC.cos]|nr:hypothetical protein AN958_01658 [Leucoagaricus sp. SymC.cos]
MALWDLHNTFPTELLSEIFLHLIVSPPSSSPTPTNTIHHPLLVSHVCSHWRTAALATPRLWARLFIQLGISKAESQAALVNTWMERSGGCSLTVYVFWEDPPFASSHPVLECLLKHSVRWKEMFFYLPFNVFRRFGKVAGKVPLLTELSLGTDTDTQDIILQMFKSAPKLASLECVNLSPFFFTFPWQNLTNIPIMAVTIEECLSILHQATSLQKAGFIFLTTSSTTANTTSARGLRPIHHPSLTHLSILTSPWDESIDLTPLFPLLSLPKLISLTICNLKSHFGTAGFTSFLSRLYSLRTLHLRKTALSDQNLVAGLRVVPTVEKLVVHPLIEGLGPPSVTDVVFDELRWKKEGDDDDEGSDGDFTARRKRRNSGLPLLPKLTSIEVKLDNAIADAFIHMIHSRRTSVHFPTKPYRYRKATSSHGEEEGKASGLVVAAEDGDEGDDGNGEEDEIDKPSILEHVRIRFSEPLHPQFISEFEDLQRDGLRIELDYMNENGGIEFVRHSSLPFDTR